MIEPRKQIIAESTSLFERKTTGVTPQRAWCDRSAGVEEHGMSARVAQEPGRAQSFLVPDAVRAPRKKQPRPVGAVRPHGSEEDHRQGSAKRRQRSAARRRLSRRSRLIVPLSAGNSPQRTRGREAADRSKHLLEERRTRTLDRELISRRQEKIAALARTAPQMVLLTLAHHIDLMWMEEAYRRTRKDGAVGVDGVTAGAYEERLQENLSDLLERFKSGRYRAPPVRRVHIPKAGSTKTRPIGIPTLEDKILQRAVLMVLEPVDEQDFLDCSYGFRPGRSAHQALEVLWKGLMDIGGGWVIDLDLQSYLDRCSYYPLAVLRSLKRSGVGSGTLILKPLRLLCETWMASSSPRLTRCNTVWRDTPS